MIFISSQIFYTLFFVPAWLLCDLSIAHLHLIKMQYCFSINILFDMTETNFHIIWKHSPSRFFVFTLKGLSPLCVNMCLCSQLWLVDGVLYTLQPFHRHTNTWRAQKEEIRAAGAHGAQSHQEKTNREERGALWTLPRGLADKNKNLDKSFLKL